MSPLSSGHFHQPSANQNLHCTRLYERDWLLVGYILYDCVTVSMHMKSTCIYAFHGKYLDTNTNGDKHGRACCIHRSLQTSELAGDHSSKRMSKWWHICQPPCHKVFKSAPLWTTLKYWNTVRTPNQLYSLNALGIASRRWRKPAYIWSTWTNITHHNPVGTVDSLWRIKAGAFGKPFPYYTLICSQSKGPAVMKMAAKEIPEANVLVIDRQIKPANGRCTRLTA